MHLPAFVFISSPLRVRLWILSYLVHVLLSPAFLFNVPSLPACSDRLHYLMRQLLQPVFVPFHRSDVTDEIGMALLLCARIKSRVKGEEVRLCTRFILGYVITLFIYVTFET